MELRYGKIGGGAKVHAIQVLDSDYNHRPVAALCGAGENTIGTRKRSPIGIIQNADASHVTCTKCLASPHFERLSQPITSESAEPTYQVGDTVTLNKNGKEGTIRYIKADNPKPYGVFLHQSESTHYYAAADIAPAAPAPEPAQAEPVWTHNYNDMLRPKVTGWRRIHQATWLFAEHEGVTGHGRTSRNRAKTARSRVSSNKTGQRPTMERNAAKQANLRNAYAQRKRPVAPVISITEVLRQLGIVERAA